MRLIDADGLIERAWRDKLDSRELIVEMINTAPTVKEIPTKIPIDIFEKLISQESKWIPVSEGLPKKDKYKDFCKCLIAVDCTTRHNICDTFTAYFDGKHFYRDRYVRNYFISGVKAWMPLPEPYEVET